MDQPITSDGRTLEASYEHNSRVINFAGKDYAGWNEMTGGGIQREGQTDVFGAGDVPRGTTDGKAVPQDLNLKLEVATWERIKADLVAMAVANGDTSATNYQKVVFQVVDQFRGATPTIPSKTITYSVKIKADKPATQSDGTQVYQEVTLKQHGVAKETYGV